MRTEHAVEDWLPGGLTLPQSVAAEVEWADFSLDETDLAPDPGDAVRAKLDLNEIHFEDLVALGISVGQAARFVSQRERRGGISALAEIDGFYGLEPGVRDILRWSGHV